MQNITCSWIRLNGTLRPDKTCKDMHMQPKLLAHNVTRYVLFNIAPIGADLIQHLVRLRTAFINNHSVEA